MNSRLQINMNVKTIRLIVLSMLITSLFFHNAADAGVDDIDPDKPYYVFAYFAEKQAFNGGGFHPGDGLYLAWSADGLIWTPLNNGHIVYKPKNSKGFRDPDILAGPDGKFRMVWTGGSGAAHGIGYSASGDLINWSDDDTIPVMENDSSARNVWAPELFYNDIFGRYMIFWSSTIPGRFPKTDRSGDDGFNHRIYFTTTKDFKTFSPTELLYDPGFNCIDASIEKFAENKYLMFLKNETLTPPRKHVIIAKAENPEGPYGNPSKPISKAGAWAEGPTEALIDGKWHVYYDMYASGRYGVSVSDDLKKWEDKTAELRMPEGARHGSVIPISGKTLQALMKASFAGAN